MLKQSAIVLTCCLLLSGTGIWPAGEVHGAERKLSLVINSLSLQEQSAGPYINGAVVMVPVRITGEKLGFGVVYIKEQNTLQLKGYGQQISLTLDGNQAILNGKEKLQLEEAPAIRNNRMYVPLSFFKQLGFLTAYDASANEVAVNTPQNVAETVIGLLVAGEYEMLWQQYFDTTTRQAISVQALKQAWETTTAPYGAYIKLVSAVATTANNQNIIVGTAEFAKGKLAISIAAGSAGEITGLRIAPLTAPEEETEVPAGIVEEEVVVGKGTANPLKGVLTLPEKPVYPLSSVVLVQGSGPADYNASAYAYKPFRDMAWGLAQQGIAVLRYDKRTYTYPQKFIGEAGAAFTVKDETLEDAVAASRLLKQDKRFDPKRVYMAGHSLGGMLAPRIDAEGGDFAGLIVLAGSPRSLWEIVRDQNEAIIKGMDDKDPLKAQAIKSVESEVKRAAALASLTEEQAKQSPSVFGLPAYYLKEMDEHPAAALARQLVKPVLVLQGGDDFQVYPDKDFALWKDVLKNNSAAVFKLYPGLNHFFVDYDGSGAGTTAEYNVPGVVKPEVITDMGQWINSQK